MKQYAIYLRKSRADLDAEAHGEMETLARHEQALFELARKNDYAVTEVYREVVSGDTIAARPQMQRLLDEVQDGRWAGVLVMDIDRLARGQTIDQGIVAQAFAFSNTLIITPSKAYDPNNEYDQEYFEFGLFMARREYKMINRRLQRGRLASFKEGKILYSIPPYGYRRVKLNGQSGYTLEPDEEQAPILKMMFELYTREDGRLGLMRLANHLNNLGVPSSQGGKWSHAVVGSVLRNPVYIGKVRWNARPQNKRIKDGSVVIARGRATPDDWMLANGLHEPLVDDEIFNRAQRLLSSNRVSGHSNSGVLKNPLAGLIVCGVCGDKMRRKPKSDRIPRDTIFCTNPDCNNVSAYVEVIEDRILSALSLWLSEYKVNKGEVPSFERDYSSELKIVKKEHSALMVQLSRLHDFLEQGIYTTDVFLERSRLLNERIAAAEKSMIDLSSEQQGQAARLEGRHSFVPMAENIMDVYPRTIDPAEKNALLKKVLQCVIYTKKKRGHRTYLPYDFDIELVPYLPD